MKTQPNAKWAFYALSTVFVLASCQKNDVATTDSADTSSGTIAVAASATSTNSASTDSIYLVQPCRRGETRDSLAQSALPANVTAYISATYSGATFAKAFALKNSSSTLTGYVVVIYYNNKPVGLQFDSSGNFVKVLEQREKGDLNGAGWHHGGRFEHRDGRQRDTLALSALPPAVTLYLQTNYASDTLLKAFRNRDSSLVVLSKNNGLFATVFTAGGSFVSREPLPTRGGRPQSIDLAALPSAAASYLSQTYPNYVFEKAFVFTENGTVKGYVVLIDANNTKYAVLFDASGSFVKAKPVH